jgi:hypothetical protein
MMLDRQAFATEMRALADRFNRTLTDDLARRYYQHLQHLNTPAFMAAAQTIYANDTFWPAPNRFLEAAGVDATTLAEQAWEHALTQASRGTNQPPDMNPPEYWTALKAVGGVTSLGRTNERNLPFLRKDFVRAYTQHHNGSTPAIEKPETPTLPTEITDRVLS